MNKQDRQGVRTATDLDRRYDLGSMKKSYKAVVEMSTEARGLIGEVATVLRNEFNAKIDELVHETADNLENALKDYVKTADYDAFKNTVQTIFQGFEMSLQDCIRTEEYEEFKSLTESAFADVESFLKPYDSWIALTVESGFIVRNNDASLTPVCKITGNVVTVCGVVSNVAEMESTSSGVVFASGIPEAYRPHMDQHFVCQGSGMNRWQCSVKTDGTLMMSRYGITEQGTMGANTWLPFSCTYQI